MEIRSRVSITNAHGECVTHDNPQPSALIFLIHSLVGPYFRLCEYLFLLKRSGMCSYFGSTYYLDIYQDEAAYAWPSVFYTDYQPRYIQFCDGKHPAILLTQYTGTTFLGTILIFSIGFLKTSRVTSPIGYSLVLLWNWVPEKPPTKPPLLPSLDYVSFNSCKILAGCVVTIALAVSSMPVSSMYVVFAMLSLFGRSVLICVACTSRFLNATSIAITTWGSGLNLFRPLEQAVSSALVCVGFVTLFRIAAESLSETLLSRRRFRLSESTFVTFYASLIPSLSQSRGLSFYPACPRHRCTNFPR